MRRTLWPWHSGQQRCMGTDASPAVLGKNDPGRRRILCMKVLLRVESGSPCRRMDIAGCVPTRGVVGEKVRLAGDTRLRTSPDRPIGSTRGGGPAGFG